MKNDKFVLYTSDEEYVVEYLFNELVLSKSITEAKTFINSNFAHNFKDLLLKERELKCSVNTYIN